MEKKNTTNNSNKQAAMVAGVAAGVAALAAAGYFILGPNGKNNRKQIKGWTFKMKGDVLERLEKLKDVTPEVYNAIIDDVSLKYGKLKSIQAGEIAEIAADMKKHWNAISRDIKAKEKGGRTSRSVAKKTSSPRVAKKAPKKVAKKTTTETSSNEN